MDDQEYELNVLEFKENVWKIADKIGALLNGEDALLCLPALSLIIGSCLAQDLIGKSEQFEDFDSAIDTINEGIKLSYNKFKDV